LLSLPIFLLPLVRCGAPSWLNGAIERNHS
jgi:hypothetical protein